jgi:hypothetical protein
LSDHITHQPSIPVIRHCRFALAVALAVVPVHAASAQDAERAAVLGTVQKLWDAMRTRDTVLLKQVFDTSARLVRAGRGGAALQITTPAQFAASIMRNPTGPAPTERMYDPEVRIDGTIAQVWTYYTFHSGATFSHCGIDAITLVKLGDTWKITHITDTARMQGCTRVGGGA